MGSLFFLNLPGTNLLLMPLCAFSLTQEALRVPTDRKLILNTKLFLIRFYS